MEDEELDIRSEVVKDFLEKPPAHLVRWGSTFIFLIFLIALLLSWLIKYPLVIAGQFNLTTKAEPKPVVTKFAGRLERVFVKEGQEVNAGELLALTESTASYEQILTLEEEMKSIRDLVEKEDLNTLRTMTPSSKEQLGDVQPLYQQFKEQLNRINTLFHPDTYDRNIGLIQEDIASLNSINSQLRTQAQLHERDVQISMAEFEISKKLFEQKVVTQLDLEREESKVLSKKVVLQRVLTDILSNNIAVNAKKKELVELANQRSEEIERLKQSVYALINGLNSWRNQHLLVAPTLGIIEFQNNLHEKLIFDSGNPLFYIMPKEQTYRGTLRIAQTNSGKVRMGQQILIKFDSYPFEEYGVVNGVVANVSQLIAAENNEYFALVDLPNGLRTIHGKELVYKYGMKANAEVITEDLRFIERIFYTIRRAFG